MDMVLLQRFSSTLSHGFEDEDFWSSPSWWAATIAIYCPSRPVELLNSSSSKPCNRVDVKRCMSDHMVFVCMAKYILLWLDIDCCDQCDHLLPITKCFSSVNGDHAEVFRRAGEVIERVVAHIDGSRDICNTESKSRYIWIETTVADGYCDYSASHLLWQCWDYLKVSQ